MSDNIPFIRPPEELKVNAGNPAHSWRKWKQKFEIYLKATGTSKKSDEIKVGLLLNHIGDQCVEIYSNFAYLPERDNPDGREKLPAENPEHYKTVIEKSDAFFMKRPTTEQAAACKFWSAFVELAVRESHLFLY